MIKPEANVVDLVERAAALADRHRKPGPRRLTSEPDREADTANVVAMKRPPVRYRPEDYFTSTGYMGLPWEGMARMAWARARAGVELNAADRRAMAEYSEEESRW